MIPRTNETDTMVSCIDNLKSTFVVGNGMSRSKEDKRSVKKPRRQWKKPKGMPKRPLSAYNLFFAEERKRLLEMDVKTSSRQKGDSPKRLGFGGLARAVASKWKTVDPSVKMQFQRRANIDRLRYKSEMKDWENMIASFGEAPSHSKVTVNATRTYNCAEAVRDGCIATPSNDSVPKVTSAFDGIVTPVDLSGPRNHQCRATDSRDFTTYQEIQVSLAQQMLKNLSRGNTGFDFDVSRAKQSQQHEISSQVVTLANTIFSGSNPASKAHVATKSVSPEPLQFLNHLVAPVASGDHRNAVIADAASFLLMPNDVFDASCSGQAFYYLHAAQPTKGLGMLLHTLDTDELEYLTQLKF